MARTIKEKGHLFIEFQKPMTTYQLTILHNMEDLVTNRFLDNHTLNYEKGADCLLRNGDDRIFMEFREFLHEHGADCHWAFVREKGIWWVSVVTKMWD
jgi:hypothetical protein